MNLIRLSLNGFFAVLAAALAAPTLALAEVPAQQPGGLLGMAPLIIIFVIFYFLLIRPQQKKVKEHQAMVEALKAGDKVVTNGGLHGTISEVREETVLLEVAGNVKVTLSKDAVAVRRPKE